MKCTVTSDDGGQVDFECADTITSVWTCNSILEGKTHPVMSFAGDVQVVFDVGANCGAASIYFARHYPGAEIHAFEPASEPRAILERNSARYPNVARARVRSALRRPVVPLYLGRDDSVLNSIFRRDMNLDESEPVQLRVEGEWTAEQGIDRIDVLKIDVAGCEVAVLRSLESVLPTVKVLYAQYDWRPARREIDQLLGQTHELYRGACFLDQGECIYLRNDLADHEGAGEHMQTLLGRMFANE